MSRIHRSFPAFLGAFLLFSFLESSLQAGVKLFVPAGYLPGRPLIARVEVQDATGAPNRDLWNAEATLTADSGVLLSTNRVILRNGVGIALLTVTGASDFTLTARVNGEENSRLLANRTSQPITSVSGILPGASTTWSGVVNITGNVTVPAGHILTIQPDTIVVINGAPSENSGISLIVNGVVRSLGTEALPVTITSSDPGLNWGQIIHQGLEPSIYQHTFISKAGRAPGEGHTGSAPVFRVRNSNLTLDNVVVSDLNANGSNIGKIMFATDSDLVLRDCVFSRARMGPEIAGTGLLCTNSYFMDMNGPDDADGIYLHDANGRELVVSNCVFAGGDDDAVDTLDSTVLIENSILRDWPNPNEDAKGVSAFSGEVILRRCLIVNCFAGVSAKSNGPLGIIRIDHCTITGIDKGVSAATKSNATEGNLQFYITNSIVRAPDAIHSDFAPDRFVSVTYCNLSESWPGIGNQSSDPWFVNAAAGDFNLRPGSPCIDAGDPAAPPDADFSRSDIGFFVGASGGEGFFLALASPTDGAVFQIPASIPVEAVAATSTGAVNLVQFFSGNTRIGEDISSPYSLSWSNASAGIHQLTARALRSDGVTITSAPVNILVASDGGPTTNELVAAGTQWLYLDDGSDQGAAWTALAFDDLSWKLGQAQLGYGDDGEITVLGFGPDEDDKYVTYYFRKVFTLEEDPARVLSLTLDLLRDDGAVVYVNGQEAYRVEMPAGPIDYLTYATDTDEYDWESAPLPASLLRQGPNVIAVEVHQGSDDSSDLAFDLGLSAVIAPPNNVAPVVSISAPASGTIFGVPADFEIAAHTLDFDGFITNVAFFANSNLLGSDTTAPFTFEFNSGGAGNFAVAAVATDNLGLSRTSDVVVVTVSADIAPPAVVGQFPPPGVVTNLSSISVTFSKDVLGVDASDLLINGLPAESVSRQGRTFTFLVPWTPEGIANISWSASHGITDNFIPANFFEHTVAGSTWQYQLVDTKAPYIENLAPLTGATISTLTNLTITFSEPVTGLNASDLLINSIPASTLAGSGAGPYAFSFQQPPAGAVTINWVSAHDIHDLANNSFFAAPWNYRLDPTQSPILISEIMYHPISENSDEEYIELFNRGANPVNLSGWRFSDGIEFDFPDLTLAPGAYLVVAADLATFGGKYPGVTNVIGNWTGSLSNSREDIDLDDPTGARADSVRYADEGDWAVRQRSSLDRGQRGWVWFAEHDGLGKSAELINPGVANDNGQNWASSLVIQGTPGRQNSVFDTQTAPIIENAAHSPVVPRSTDQVVVNARISGSTGPGSTVALWYRVDSLTPGAFQSVAMRDDGLQGDAVFGDNLFTAILPPQTNNAVVEYYISVSDPGGNSRSWPAPAIAAVDGFGPTGQVANALYQVDDSENLSSQPLYKIIMTENERAVLESIGDNFFGTANSDAQMNATFISIDGTSTDLQYLTGVRNRGHGTRAANPNNFRVNFRSDQPWKGVLALNLNAQFSWLQVLGAAIHTKSGSVGADSRAVQLRVNNANLTSAGNFERTYGSYAANEVINADWADHHFPNDGNGNIYRAVRDLPPVEFDYRTIEAYPLLFGGENKNSYTNTWFKESNASEDDWTDLIAMLRVLGANGIVPFTPEEVRRVIDVEQWLRHLALMNLLGNSETGLNGGYNDDYFMYRGINDRRFVLMYYDLDQILGFNNAYGPASSIFSAETDRGTGRAMGRILRHPEFEPIYYAQLRDLIETTLSAAEFNSLVDEVLGDFVPVSARDGIKSYMEQRRNYVASLLPPAAAPLPVATITAPPRSPTPRTAATFEVGGDGVTHYRYSLNGGALSPETPVQTPIALTALANGTNTISVIGRNAAGLYQSIATEASWIINSSWPALRLNEIIASRSGNLRDQLELYNEGTTTIDLAGLRLTDDPAQPGRFTFGSATLGPGAFLVLDSSQLGFSFEASGEGVYLFDKLVNGGALLDSVEFGNQVTDLSIARVGENGQWHLSQPSFGAHNLPEQLGDTRRVKINEWLASGVSPFPDDFIELFNPETLPVAIGGAFLTDQRAGDPTKNHIAALSFISGRGHVAFVSGNGNSPDEINFLLPAEQGEIALLAPDHAVIDSIIYGPQSTGISMGRCADGEASLKFLEFPTPGAPNECPVDPGPPQFVTLIPFNHVWKYNSSGADLGFAWKEFVYDDTAWPSGPGVLGFDNSQLPEPLLTEFSNTDALTYYFRASFQNDPGISPSALRITHLVDDGAAFYLNGQEINPRFNLAGNATFETAAASTISTARLQEFTIPANALRPGANVLAVEVHQVTRDSSDLIFGLKLDAVVTTNSAVGVSINEVFANNSGLAEAGDWIELYNPSTDAIDLGGMSLTDDNLNPTRWIFPSGSILNGRGFLRIAFNPDAAISGTNTGFELKADGGSVFLFHKPAEGQGIQSSVTYGLQAANWSIGRVPDGSANWVLNIPSPENPNTAAAPGNPALLRINEWMADPLTGADWFEIFNPDFAPVDLSGLMLADSLTERAQHEIPQLSFIGTGAHAYQVFVADEELTLGADHVNFRLGAGGESIALSSRTGVLIDGVSFGAQLAGISEGRLPDGGANIARFPSASSPGFANHLSAENDSDGDGMPNDWELAHGFNPSDPADGAADFDQDAFSNAAEFLAGTDPRNAGDFLHLEISLGEAVMALSFNAVPGRSYTVFYSDGSLLGPWRTLTVVGGDSTVGPIQVNDTNPAGTARYYRLIVQAAD